MLLLLLLSVLQVIAYAMGRGPLAMSHCSWTQNLLQFGVVLSTPIIPRDGESRRAAAASCCNFVAHHPIIGGGTLCGISRLHERHAAVATRLSTLH
jgi:hypothetical protein